MASSGATSDTPDDAPSSLDEAFATPSRRARLGVGAAIFAVIAVLVVTVAVGIFRGASTPTELVGPAEDAAVSVDESGIYVHVSGAVRAPGLYRLASDARVFDAIAAAAGFAEDADQSAVNLARVLSDGEQLVVGVIGALPPTGDSAAAGDGRINLNTATGAELDTLPRIGPAMAQRIIDWRDANGRFTSVEDLLAVPGIGDKMLEALRDLVVV